MEVIQISPVLLFTIGLLLLWPGSELVVRGAIIIGQKLKVAPTIIGVTILSIGTGLPEIAVNYTGAYSRLMGVETSPIVVGNIIGTAISQITIILGVVGIWYGVSVKREDLLKVGTFLLLAVLLVWRLGNDGLLSRADGVLMVALYFAFLYLIITKRKVEKLISQTTALSLPRASTLILLGFGLVILASDMVVRYGSEVAVAFGLSEAAIGLFLVGFGTSLPELAVSLWALAKNQPAFSVGNLLGSSVLAILVALGGSAVVSEWQVDPAFLNFDIPLLFAITVLVLVFFYSKKKLERREAFILMTIYLGYIGMRSLVV